VGVHPAAGVSAAWLVAVSSNGAASIHRTRTRTLPLGNLNEDSGAVPNPDELRAVVTLTPVAPAAVSRESNQVALNIA
jgi:hypothetical protein